MMRLSDFNIGEIIKGALENYNPSTSFEETWNKQQEDTNSNYQKRSFSLRKRYAVPLIAMMMCMTLFTVGFASYQIARKVDKTDYSFVDDANVIGKWKSVDFVRNIADFNQGQRSTNIELYLNELVFIKEGKMLCSFENENLAYTPTTWTKGKILDKQEKTASNYDIRNINGKTYLFMQWKSGDYVFRGAEPAYYVLEKVDSQDYSNYKVTVVKEDKIDYPFEENIQMHGNWESVDFVKKIDQFKPGLKGWLDDLYLKKLELSVNGETNMVFTSGNYNLSWTRDLIIDKRYKTASKCTIKEIDGNTYMFYEWKSGDYTYRGRTPSYYVLKKVD